MTSETERIEVRCPACQYKQLQFIITEHGQTTIEIKCRGRKCSRILQVTITDDGHEVEVIKEPHDHLPTHRR